MNLISSTKQTRISVVLGTTAVEVFGPNPLRKALLFNPLAGFTTGAQALSAAVYGKGGNQVWTVPNGVTQMLDAYGWGSGGNSGASGAALGGGGGGGGAFCSAGPQTVVPGSQWAIVVGAGGGTTNTTLANPSSSGIIQANFGATPVLNAAGAGGTASVGVDLESGAAGAASTALGGTGAGGGSSGGSGSPGNAGAGAVGGAAAGIASFDGYGVGGAGGNGSILTVNGLTGGNPGGGGGGGGKTGGAVGPGADGQLVIFYATPDPLQAISLSPDPNVQVGLGVINILPGRNGPVILTDLQFGRIINEPWYAISGVASVVFKAMEFSYDVPQE